MATKASKARSVARKAKAAKKTGAIAKGLRADLVRQGAGGRGGRNVTHNAGNTG